MGIEKSLKEASTIQGVGIVVRHMLMAIVRQETDSVTIAKRLVIILWVANRGIRTEDTEIVGTSIQLTKTKNSMSTQMKMRTWTSLLEKYSWER